MMRLFDQFRDCVARLVCLLVGHNLRENKDGQRYCGRCHRCLLHFGP
jgi:hypothetical protein